MALPGETYKKTDTQFLDAEKDNCRDDGSTASTAILVQNHLYVANVGDSRAVVSKAGKAIPLSEDQKPNRSDERKRIESAGGVVMWAGTWRVGGVLAMSRAFGNRMLKQYVVAEPEIQELEVNTELELIVLASDGLWDVVPNEDAVSIARAEEEPETAARKLTETAFSRGSADNITCIVVKFNHGTGEVLAPHSEHNEETELHENENEKTEDTRPEGKKEQPKSHAVHEQKTENKLPSETEDSAAHLAGTFGEKSSVFEFVGTGIGSDRLHSTNTIDRRFRRPVKRKKAVPSESASFPHPSLLEDARGPLPEEVHAINSNSSREIASLKGQKKGSYSHTDSHAMESSSHEAPVEGVAVTELVRLAVEAEKEVEALIRKDKEKDREIEQLKKTIATLLAEKEEAEVRCAEQYIRNATLNNSLSSVERKVVELEDGRQTERDRARELSERLEEMERRAKALKEDLVVALKNKLLNVNTIQAEGFEAGYRAAFRDTKARLKKVNPPNFDFVKYERLEKEHFEARAAKLRAAKARLEEEFGLSFGEG